MASFGQVVTGFLLCCLCCFYQTCLSNSSCVEFPSACKGVNNTTLLFALCASVKGYSSSCVPLPSSLPNTTDGICLKLSEMKISSINDTTCKQACSTSFVDTCKYIYSAWFYNTKRKNKPFFFLFRH